MKLLTLLIAFCFATPALAQEGQPPELTRLEVDQDADVIRVIVDGKAVAQFTSSGLMVVGDIEYGGIIRDRGSEAIGHAIEISATPEGEGDAP